MIVTCPNCKTRYRVDMSQISDKGRRVRCRTCRHAWRQLPVEDNEPEAFDPLFNPKGGPPVPPPAPPPKPKPPAKPKPKPKPKPEPVMLDDPLFGPGPGATDNSTAPAIDPLFGEPALEDPFESRMARRRMAADDMMASIRNKAASPDKHKTPIWVWAGFAAIILTLAGGGYGFITFRDQIAMAVPATAKAYSMLAETLGMPELVVNVRGLTFRGVDHTRGYVGNEPYMSVTGAVVNSNDTEVDVPPIRIAFYDEAKQLIEVQLARAQAEKVAPNQSVKFGIRLPKVPANVAFVEVSFARPEEIPPGGIPPLAPEKPAMESNTGETPPGEGGHGEAGTMEPAPAEPAGMAPAAPEHAPAAPEHAPAAPEPKHH